MFVFVATFLLAAAILALFARGQAVSLLGILRKPSGDASATVTKYTSMWGTKRDSVFHNSSGEDKQEQVDERKASYATVTNAYYDVVTDFYEYGWGQSFHFAPRTQLESLPDSIRRHQHWLAKQLNLQPGEKVLDLGCGVCGPMREIALFTGAHIIGVNNNDYQVARGTEVLRKAGLSETCSVVKGDFNELPFEDNSIDAIYSIEAFCHAPDKQRVFRECLRVLRPEGRLAMYDWAMGRSYNASNAAHVACKKGIELGNGIADLPEDPEVIPEALRAVGFRVAHTEDRVDTYRAAFDIPWWTPLGGGISLAAFRTSTLGRLLTHGMLTVMVAVHLAPPASIGAHNILVEAAHRLVEGGQENIFTPMYFALAVKP